MGKNMKNRNKMSKEAGVLLIAVAMILTTVSVTANTNNIQKVMKSYEEVDIRTDGSSNNPLFTKGVFSDSFETYPDFVVDNFPPWTTYDGDGSTTWGVEGVEWPNVGYEGAFMIFNPDETTPPFTAHPAHTGVKYASCWDSVTPPNDDWLFSPQLHMEEDGVLSFWGRSLNDAYGLEEIEYGISTTDTDPSSFTIVSGGVIDVPTVWTEYTYNLTDYIGQDIYIGIHVVSYDHFAFFLDDFEVTGVSYQLPPDLDCDGALSWVNVSVGTTITDSITVENIGGGLLGWEIVDEPSWGTWTFEPASGDDLASGAPLTIDVTVIAPEDKNEVFSGTIKIENKEDAGDFCFIDVYLSTPKNKAFNFNYPMLNWLFERFPNIFPALRYILGL
jgi:hypothetical protein